MEALVDGLIKSGLLKSDYKKTLDSSAQQALHGWFYDDLEKLLIFKDTKHTETNPAFFKKEAKYTADIWVSVIERLVEAGKAFAVGQVSNAQQAAAAYKIWVMNDLKSFPEDPKAMGIYSTATAIRLRSDGKTEKPPTHKASLG